MLDLNLEKPSVISEQSLTNNLPNGRVIPIQSPTIPQEYYGSVIEQQNSGMNDYFN